MDYVYNYLPAGSARYESVVDAHARFILGKQLKDRSLWEKFVQVFIDRPDHLDHGWRGEYYGKMMRGACLTYRYAPDEELYGILYDTVKALLHTQDEYGRITTYPKDFEFRGWDMWIRKYVLVGSLYFYEICRDEDFKAEILERLEHHVDYMIEHLGDGEGKMSILDTSAAWAGLNSSTVLEPVIQLYKLTGKQKFLDFGKYVLDQGGCHGGNLLELAEAGDIYPYQYPQVKAYEMMSYFEGALAWYEVTGQTRYLRIVEKFVQAVRESDITIIGCAGCTHELFDHSAVVQTEPSAAAKGIMQETCVTVTWMRLLERLLRLTGNASYVEEIERSAYNALYGSLNPFNQTQYSFEDKDYVAGVPFDSYSPLVYQARGIGIGGYKKFSFGGYYGCCACIGAAGTALFPLIQVLAYDQGFVFNGYQNGVVSATTPAGNPVTFTVSGAYIEEGEVRIKIGLEAPESFAIKLRVPEWSREPVFRVCGEPFEAVKGYCQLGCVWHDGDVITLSLHPEVERVVLNGKQAYLYGNVVLARDEKKELADINEPFAPVVSDGHLVLNQIDTQPGEMVRFVLETDKGQVLLTDYAWCGKHWNEQNSAIAVWLPTEGEV
ncbi:MAG: glycoside hydrolase family 127 protein [Clostridia bacterium]|nr:glycoside hydrolase family 127 protein [Clostridia bacterium]